MYTFTALAPIDTMHNHTGLVIVSFCVFIWAIAAWINSWDFTDFAAGMFFPVIVLAITAGISFYTGDIKTFANTQVEGTFVGFQSEGWNQQSGKSRADHHVTYVIYSVPEGNVMLPAATGQTYPQKAILYKN